MSFNCKDNSIDNSYAVMMLIEVLYKKKQINKATYDAIKTASQNSNR